MIGDVQFVLKQTWLQGLEITQKASLKVCLMLKLTHCDHHFNFIWSEIDHRWLQFHRWHVHAPWKKEKEGQRADQEAKCHWNAHIQFPVGNYTMMLCTHLPTSWIGNLVYFTDPCDRRYCTNTLIRVKLTCGEVSVFDHCKEWLPQVGSPDLEMSKVKKRGSVSEQCVKDSKLPMKLFLLNKNEVLLYTKTAC